MILVGVGADADEDEAGGDDWGWGLRREAVGAPEGATVRSRANLTEELGFGASIGYGVARLDLPARRLQRSGGLKRKTEGKRERA